MRRALRWMGTGLLGATALVFFAATGAVLQARAAVDEGALERHFPPCKDLADYGSNRFVMNHVDNVMWRAIAGLPREGKSQSNWRMRAAYASIGTRLAYSAEERRAMVLPKLEALPMCERRGG